MTQPNSLHTPSHPASSAHVPSHNAAATVTSVSAMALPNPQQQLDQLSQPHTQQLQSSQNVLNIDPQEQISELKEYLSTHCLAQISAAIETLEPVVLIDLTVLQSKNPSLYTTIQSTPDIIVLFGSLALQLVMYEYQQHELGELGPQDQYNAQLTQLYNKTIEFIKSAKLYVHNAPVSQQVGMRNLSPFFVDKLIQVSGLLINKSENIPEMAAVSYRCLNCGAHAEQILTKQLLTIPQRCGICNHQIIEIDYSKSRYISKVILKIQEQMDNDSAAPGETPIAISCEASLAQSQSVKTGDLITITCIYRVAREYVNGRQLKVRACFRPFLEVLWVEPAQLNERHKTVQLQQLLNDELYNYQHNNVIPDDLKALIPQTDSQTDQNLLRLVNSIAPSIFGSQYFDIKLSLLLQAVRGSFTQQNEEPGTSGAAWRENIHILLIGDPGQAKSQLVKFMASIVPRSLYTSGKNSSQAGLTANVTKGLSGDSQLEPGLLVLCDGGLCALDELDKVDATVRGALNECMEQQTVSVAKAGVVCTLDAKTAILAAANPVDSRYNQNKTVLQNLNLDSQLISRFDLIFLMLDQNDEQTNRDLAAHLLSLQLGVYNNEQGGQQHIPVQVLQRYINLARTVKVQLTEEAKQELMRSYVQLRSRSGAGRVQATPRQLISVLRLAQARAKLRFQNLATVQDVKVAQDLLIAALKMSATDKSGLIDIQLLTGQHRVDYQRIESLAHQIMLILAGSGSQQNRTNDGVVRISMGDLIERLDGHTDMINEAVNFLIDNGSVARQQDQIFLVTN